MNPEPRRAPTREVVVRSKLSGQFYNDDVDSHAHTPRRDHCLKVRRTRRSGIESNRSGLSRAGDAGSSAPDRVTTRKRGAGRIGHSFERHGCAIKDEQRSVDVNEIAAALILNMVNSRRDCHTGRFTVVILVPNASTGGGIVVRDVFVPTGRDFCRARPYSRNISVQTFDLRNTGSAAGPRRIRDKCEFTKVSIAVLILFFGSE